MKYAYAKTWYRIRWQVLERDNFQCQSCGQYAPNVPLEVDHRRPLTDGGNNELENLVTACWSCNRGKNYSALWRTEQLEPKKPRSGPRQQSILALLRKNGPMTCYEMADHFGVNPATIRMTLQRMLRKGDPIEGVYELHTKSQRWRMLGLLD